MPHVTFRRLDGDTPSVKRHDVVTNFNNDPTIDMLLLTTAVGGLGLNLTGFQLLLFFQLRLLTLLATGADTVIFMEHDWNPMKDMQAMDRAHRIGQTKVQIEGLRVGLLFTCLFVLA